MGLSNFAHTEEQRAAGLQLLEERIRGHHSWDHEGGPDAFQGDHRVLVPWGLLWYILREHGVILMRLDHPGDKIKVEEALRLATWAGGELHWTTLDSLSTLSLLYHRRFDMKKSEQTLLKMSHLLDKIPPERRSRKIRYQSARNAVRLGQVYAHNRRFAEAEEQLHMALSIGEQLSDLHLQAFAAFELGASCLKHGQYEEAEMWLRKTFDWQAATLGDGHTNTLGTIAELAWVYAVQNDQERAQHMLGLAFSSKVVSSTTSNLIAFSSHLRYMRARGEDTSPMEPILKRAWDEALEILRSGGHKTLSFPHFRSLYTTYDDLEQFYREKKRKKELKAIRRDMAPFEADWDAFHWSEKSDSMSSEHLGEGTDDEAHADQGNPEQGVADEGNSDGRNSLQAGSDPGEADAVVTGSRDPISRPHERRASV
jgi:tetratricopeptide (TPR) repeat protein